MAITPIDKFIVHLCVPPLLLLAIFGAYASSLRCICKKNSHKSKEIKAVRKETAIKIMIFIVQLLYPGIATRIFGIWRCQNIDISETEQINVFIFDYNVLCHEGNHAAVAVVAVVFMVLYVAGFPFAVYTLLTKNKPYLYDNSNQIGRSIEYEYGALYLQYEKVRKFSPPLIELVWMFKRLSHTSVYLFVVVRNIFISNWWLY